MSEVLGGMPTYQARVPVQTPGIVQVPGGEAYGALAQSMDRLSRAFNETVEPIVTAQSQREGRSAVELGEDGMPRAPQLRSEISAAGRAFNAAAVQQYQDTSEMYWGTRFQALRSEHRDNPQAFYATGRQMIEGAAQSMPEAIRGQITARLSSVLQAHTRGVTADMQQRVERQAQTAWTMAYTQQGDELEAYAVNGQIGSPEAQALMQRTLQHVQAGVAAGHLSPEMARLEREALADRVMANGIAGQAERIAREQGVEAGERFLVERLSQPDVAGAGARAISQARAEGARRLGLFRSERTVEDQAVRDALQNVRQTFSAGGSVSPSDIERLAVRAERANLPIVAGEFRAIGTLSGEARTWANMTIPQLNEAFAQAMTRAPAEADRNETGPRIQLLQRALTHRLEQFNRDPIAAARANSQELRELEGRVVRGQATTADLIRAQDAAIRANGFDPTGAPVMSRAAAQGLVRSMSALPAEQAAERLVQTFEAYGLENRARLWDTLRQADMPAHLRAVTVMLASPDQRDAMRRYVTITNEQDWSQRLESRIREDDRRGLNDVIQRAMVGFERTQSGTATDQQLFNDTRSVVRTLALDAMTRSIPAEQAVAEAVRQVVTQGWRVVEPGSRAAWRVPAGVQYDDAQFTRVTRDLLTSGVLENLRFRIPEGAIAADLPPEERQRAYRESLAGSATWRSTPEGRGAMLTDSAGRPVFMEDNRPFRVMFDEVRQGTYPAGAPRGALPNVGVTRGLLDRTQSVGAAITQAFPAARITSGARNGPSEAQHAHGTAIDISLAGLDQGQREALVRRVLSGEGPFANVRGIGTYNATADSLHVDTRAGAFAAWGPNRSRTSLHQTPAWFQSLVEERRARGNGSPSASREELPPVATP